MFNSYCRCMWYIDPLPDTRSLLLLNLEHPITSSLSPSWMALLCCDTPWGSWSGSHCRRTWLLPSISLNFSWRPVRAWLRISSKPARVIQTARIFSCPFFVAQPDRYIIQRKLGLIQDIRLYENLSPPNLLHSTVEQELTIYACSYRDEIAVGILKTV